MSFDPVPILNAITSHALASGLFERVNGAEPANAPGNGLTAAVWADTVAPVPPDSGLASTSARIAFMVRIYSSMLSLPPDAVDPNVLSATSALMVAYSGDFEFGGTVRNVDLLGARGPGLIGQAGYITQDGQLFRVMTITVPVIVDAVFPQAP